MAPRKREVSGPVPPTNKVSTRIGLLAYHPSPLEKTPKKAKRAKLHPAKFKFAKPPKGKHK